MRITYMYLKCMSNVLFILTCNNHYVYMESQDENSKWKIIMGMYTEIYINTQLKKDISNKDLNFLRSLFDYSFTEEVKPLLENGRIQMIGRGESYYFNHFSISVMKYDDIAETWGIISCSNLKNYNNEIEDFFAYLKPLCDVDEDNDFIGYHRYEEAREPTLVYAKEL